MIKKLSILLVLLCIAVTGHAQVARFSAGVKGLAVATVNPKTETSSPLYQFGGGAGAYLGVRFADVVGLRAEAMYAYQVGSKRLKYTGDMYEVITYSISNNSLMVPVMLQVWCGRSFVIQAGYQQTIAVSGRVKSDHGYDVEDKGILDYGSLVAGFNIGLGKTLSVDVRYVHALQNSYVHTIDPLKGMGFQIALDVNLFTSKKSVFK